MKKLSLLFLIGMLGMGILEAWPSYPSTSPSLKIRRTSPRPKRVGLELVPTFHSCSYYWVGEKKKNIAVEFRAQGATAWQRGYSPVRIEEENMYRGSLVNLTPNTRYEVRLRDESVVLATKAMRTWGAPLRVARTIVLDQDNFKGSLKITAQGRPDGWIKYTAAPGFVLTNDHKTALLTLKRAKYIILENLTLHGGAHNAVVVQDSHYIRIINCEISGWGTLGKQRFDLDGKFYHTTPDRNGRYRSVNYSAGIALFHGSNIVIERCYLHDPRNHANAWIYSHPAGPCGIYVVNPHSTVIRYNDLVGSDLHRWNDAIEGQYNFYEDGGFNRDADIYGNFFIFCNDDNVEIDGGQQNVRCFRNRFEGSFCGLSIQGNMAGPSYVFDNIFLKMCDEFGNIGQAIKTSTDGNGLSAQTFIFNNSFYVYGGMGIMMNKLSRLTVLNNILQGVTIGRRHNMPKTGSVSDYNLVVSAADGKDLHGLNEDPLYLNPRAGILTLQKSSPARGNGCAIDNFTGVSPVDMGAYHRPGTVLPERPIPLTLDAVKLDFKVQTGAPTAKKITLKIGGKNFHSSFKVAINQAVQSWLSVTPQSGILKSGDQLTFTVKICPKKMNERANYRGAFLIRLANGYSCPLSVYATTRFQQKSRLAKPDDIAQYIELSQPDNEPPLKQFRSFFADGRKGVKLKPRQKPYVYTFTIPKEGTYNIMLRARYGGGSYRVFAAIDDEKMGQAAMSLQRNRWGYYILAPGKGWVKKVKAYNLKPGKHTLKLNPIGPIEVDLAVVTDNAKAFEPK